MVLVVLVVVFVAWRCFFSLSRSSGLPLLLLPLKPPQDHQNHYQDHQDHPGARFIGCLLWLVKISLIELSRLPWGGFGYAGLNSDLPGPQKPPETSKTMEKNTQNEIKTFFFWSLICLWRPFKGGPYIATLWLNFPG